MNNGPTRSEQAAWERLLADVEGTVPRGRRNEVSESESSTEAAIRAREANAKIADVRDNDRAQEQAIAMAQAKKRRAAEARDERARDRARRNRLRLNELPPEKLRRRRTYEAVCRRCDRTFLFESRRVAPALPADCGRDECYAETKHLRKLWAESPRSMVHTCMHCLAELPLEQRFPYCDLDCHRAAVAEQAWGTTGADPDVRKPRARGPREQTWGERHFVRIGGIYLAKRRWRVHEPDPSADTRFIAKRPRHVAFVVASSADLTRD